MELLKRAKEMQPEIPTKSSIMLGVGEEWDEILQAMDDLRAVDCNILTLGQYLQPSPNHLAIERYVHPDEFAKLKEEGLKRGLAMSSPHRSSELVPCVLAGYRWAEPEAATKASASM